MMTRLGTTPMNGRTISVLVCCIIVAQLPHRYDDLTYVICNQRLHLCSIRFATIVFPLKGKNALQQQR